jgi:meso-butanediol dehydrogenase/(S,S)-butanediol dehydrogenase/diacetyl reductase
MERFKGQVAIVTGGSDGIGRATALRLASEGAHVVICARRADRLAEAEQAIRTVGGAVETRVLDVSDANAFSAMIAEVAERHGRLDMLVNNAMSVHYGPLLDATLEGWRKDFAVNSDAVFIGTREAMRIMIPQRSGAIVNIASTAGLRAMPGMASYSASKAALIHFTAVAAMEAAAHNVRINAIVPGQVATPATVAFAEMAPEKADATTAAIPMKRSGQAAELAAAITFLLSDDASYITGVALPVDGGKAVQLYMPD